MRSRSVFLISFAIALLLIAAIIYLAMGIGKMRMGIAEISVNGASHNVYVANTPQQQALGLMNMSSIGDCAGYGNCIGMLFVFANDSSRCFWMKNTQIPLEQYWIENGVISSAAAGAPYSLNITCHSGDSVLETETGSGIVTGERVLLVKYLN